MKTIWALAFGAAVAISTPSWAGEYPERPIRLLIGYSPAGAGDLVGRIVGEAMSKHLGQSIIVENRPGAGSTLASSALVNAAPDGYTLGLATGTLFGIDQHLYKVGYQPENFTPIMRLTVSPLVLAVNTELGVSSVPEFMALVRDNPGKLNYSSSGIGGSPHVGGAIFEDIVGSKVVHVPYKGGAPALQAVAAGHVQFSFGTAASVLPLAQQGSVRMLGVSTLEPSAVAPDLAPLADQGLPGFDFSFWFGLFGPANLPDDVKAKVLNAAQLTLNDPDVRARLLATGNEAAPMASSEAFKEWAADNGAQVLERVQKANISLE